MFNHLFFLPEYITLSQFSFIVRFIVLYFIFFIYSSLLQDLKAVSKYPACECVAWPWPSFHPQAGAHKEDIITAEYLSFFFLQHNHSLCLKHNNDKNRIKNKVVNCGFISNRPPLQRGSSFTFLTPGTPWDFSLVSHNDKMTIRILRYVFFSVFVICLRTIQ